MDELRYQLDLMKAMNQKLSLREKMYRMICDTTDCAYLYHSFDKNEIISMGTWDDLFDFSVKDVKDIPKLLDMVDEVYAIPLAEVLYLEKSGKTSAGVDCMQKNKRIWLQFNCRVAYENGRPTDKLISVSNITRQKFQNEELLYMAYYDGLTGLYNRNYFVQLLGEYVKEAKDNDRTLSLMVIDIDDFRKVNDGMGIMVGDELIQQFGGFLKELCGNKIIASHLSTDIFVMAIYDPAEGRNVEYIYQKIQKRIRQPFFFTGGQSISITVSIGVAEYPDAADTPLELINCAEIVMFKAKSMGRNTIQYFDEPILNEFRHSVELDSRLKEAAFNNNFILHFQPQFHTDTKQLRGVEALIRWKDDRGHMIRPDVFIPIAERNGTIIPIGNWVVEQSIKYYAKWRKRYGIPFVLSINISSVQCNTSDFVDNVIDVIQKYQVHPEEIELEITESILIADFDAVIAKLQRLEGFGVRISLDDFGTGFSSLSYLKKLPINTLKIDKSFIDTVLTDPSTKIIMESIIQMVDALGFESIAEGVENEQQLKYLKTIGCDVIQGYLLGKPLPAEQIDRLLQEISRKKC